MPRDWMDEGRGRDERRARRDDDRDRGRDEPRDDFGLADLAVIDVHHAVHRVE